MPITAACELRRIGIKEFREIDYLVTGLAFELHREIGAWFIDECIYRDELAQMCAARGLNSCKEVAVTATFGSFAKTYFLDVVVNGSIPYELKAVGAIHPAHRNQTLNYLMLTGLAHAKIFNMRCSSVQYEFVSTSITPADRYAFELNFDGWLKLGADSEWFKDVMRSLIHEWGVFLDVTLYYDAITHFRGHENVIRHVDVLRRSRAIGRQPIHVISQDTAFKITAISKDLESFEKRLRKFLAATSLRAIQWINFSRQNVTFKTLVRDSIA
jgi:GxxExxY protein